MQTRLSHWSSIETVAQNPPCGANVSRDSGKSAEWFRTRWVRARARARVRVRKAYHDCVRENGGSHA